MFGLNLLEQHTPQYNLLDDNLGIVTAGDCNVFDGIRILHASVKNKINFLCYDIGFTEQQTKWAFENNLNIKRLQIPKTHANVSHWQTYLKPWVIEDSPFDYTLWIDSDCVVTGNLSLASAITNKQTFFVQHWIKQESLRPNNKKLYEEFPTETDQLVYVNAGVFGINKKTDAAIISDWKMLLTKGLTESPYLLEYIINWDEGALNWAIQKNKASCCIIDDYRYNCFSAFCSLSNVMPHSYYHQRGFFIEGTSSFPQIAFRKMLQNKEPFVLHFATRMNNKRKYWTQWQNL